MCSRARYSAHVRSVQYGVPSFSLCLSLCEHGYTMTVLVERCQSAWGRRARWGSCYGLTRHERTRARACVRCEYSLRVQSSYVFRCSSTIYVRLCTRGVLRARACASHGVCTLGVVPCSCWSGGTRTTGVGAIRRAGGASWGHVSSTILWVLLLLSARVYIKKPLFTLRSARRAGRYARTSVGRA